MYLGGGGEGQVEKRGWEGDVPGEREQGAMEGPSVIPPLLKRSGIICLTWIWNGTPMASPFRRTQVVCHRPFRRTPPVCPCDWA